MEDVARDRVVIISRDYELSSHLCIELYRRLQACRYLSEYLVRRSA